MIHITEEVNREERSSSGHRMCKAPAEEKSMAQLEGLGEGPCDPRDLSVEVSSGQWDCTRLDAL